MDIEALKLKMSEAMETGEVLNFIYHGGSEPGKARQLQPRRIEGDKVMAFCFKSNRVKGYLIEKLELSNSDSSDYSGEYQQSGEHQQCEEPHNLHDGIAPYLDELKRLGWAIRSDDCSIELYLQFKSGKLRKYPFVVLDHRPDNFRKPWYACGCSYKYFSKALQAFMSEARNNAPNK